MLPTLASLVDSLRIHAPFDVVEAGDRIPLRIVPDLQRSLEDLVKGITLGVSIPNVAITPKSLSLTPAGTGTLTSPATNIAGSLTPTSLTATPGPASLTRADQALTGTFTQTGTIKPVAATLPDMNSQGTLTASAMTLAGGTDQLNFPDYSVGGSLVSSLAIAAQNAGLTLPSVSVAGELVTSIVGTVTVKPLKAMPKVTFRWEVQTADGGDAGDAVAFFDDSPTPTPKPKELAAPAIVFMPIFTQLTTQVAVDVNEYRVFCTVKIEAETTTEVKLGPVPLRVPMVPIPAALVLSTAIFPWTEKEKASLLIAVPAASPLMGVESLIPPLRKARQILNRVRLVHIAFAPQYHGVSHAISSLLDLVHVATQVSFERRDQISNLDSVITDPGVFWFLSRGFGRVASSLLLIGPPELKIGCYSNYDLARNDKWFEMTLGNFLHCSVPNLGYLSTYSGDARVNATHDDQNDVMRSLRFFPTTRGLQLMGSTEETPDH